MKDKSEEELHQQLDKIAKVVRMHRDSIVEETNEQCPLFSSLKPDGTQRDVRVSADAILSVWERAQDEDYAPNEHCSLVQPSSTIYTEVSNCAAKSQPNIFKLVGWRVANFCGTYITLFGHKIVLFGEWLTVFGVQVKIWGMKP